MAGMNLGLQEHVIKRKLRNRGINPDKIDLEAELDSTLSLPENLQKLEDKYGRLERTGRNTRARQEQAQGRRRKQARREARSHFQELPPYRRYIDQTKTAETTFADPTERQMEKWKENPNQYDIKGVDTRMGPEARPQAELPFQRERDNLLYQGSEGELRKSLRKVPASIKKNAEGKRNLMARQVEKQGLEERHQTLVRSSVNQNALVENYDLPDVIEEEREKKRIKRREFRNRRQNLMDFELDIEEKGGKLQAGSNTKASQMLSDNRSDLELRRDNRGKMDDRTDQVSLRSQGAAKKKSEKALDKWEDNYI